MPQLGAMPGEVGAAWEVAACATGAADVIGVPASDVGAFGAGLAAMPLSNDNGAKALGWAGGSVGAVWAGPAGGTLGAGDVGGAVGAGTLLC